jgi:hypothetical protein
MLSRGWSQKARARALNAPPRRINEIVLEKRGITGTPSCGWRCRRACTSGNGSPSKRPGSQHARFLRQHPGLVLERLFYIKHRQAIMAIEAAEMRSLGLTDKRN